MAAKRNLIFFCARRFQLADFQKVAQLIQARAPDIAPFVFETRAGVKPLLAAPWFMLRPTVSIELMDARRRPRIFRGVRLRHSAHYDKIQEYRKLDAHDLPVPKWTEIRPDTALDPAAWGPYVVVKPSRGKRGAFVRIARAGRVRFRPMSEYPEDHPGRRAPMLAQRFIYTGQWPTSYRVCTYFGEPLCLLRYDGKRDQASLDRPDGFKASGGGLSIVASAMGSTITLPDDRDILDLARRVHAVFPRIPSLGLDIVREHGTGELYVLETNPEGLAWMFTNSAGREIQSEFGLDFYAQFGALDLIADRSIAIAREYAR
jgi:hypothetical protein